jgi:hypothetical protein
MKAILNYREWERLNEEKASAEEVSSFELAMDQADETDDNQMEAAISDMFGDMTESEVQEYLNQLKNKNPKWLKKLMRWIKKMKDSLVPSKGEIRRRRVKRKQRWEDNPELEIAKGAAFITWNALGAMLINWWYKNFGKEQFEKL